MTHFLSREFGQFGDDPLRHNIQFVCQYCEEIPFAKLPSEDEPGITHQPSLKALKISAQECALCSLILEAALETRKLIDAKHKGISVDVTKEYDPRNDLPDGRQTMSHFQLGGSMPSSNGYAQPSPLPTAFKPSFPFSDDASVRPWLFGNWWKSTKTTHANAPLQLMGLGVRLSQSPNIEDAEGNGEKIVYSEGNTRVDLFYHGTFLRLRADDGQSFSFDTMFGWAAH